MSIGENAAKYHDLGYNCCQCVLNACTSYTGLDDKIGLAIAGGFGGGLRSGEVCGAISGAVMALGLAFPYNDHTVPEAKERIGELTAECVKRCTEACGNVTCRDLKDKCGKTCNELIAICAQIAEQMIIENKEK